jgi:tRNA threonylcarbamoyladenosine biosynthesis protein TsaE
MLHAPIVKSLLWPDEAHTRQFAAALAAQPDIGNCYIELHGELGAGKTTFVRHLLHALGVVGRVKSPTYAIVETYEVPWREGSDGVLRIAHFDFYRFADPREWEDAGLRDMFAAPGLKLAEWPDRAAGFLPPADLALFIDVPEHSARQVRAVARSPAGVALLTGATR